jgi:hypothetical protein
MRFSRTQRLSDGELYYIIQNGVRLTGMPGWGSPADNDHNEHTWELVLLIRHLPSLTLRQLCERPRPGATRRNSEDRYRFAMHPIQDILLRRACL